MGNDGSRANQCTLSGEVDLEETSVIHITDASDQQNGEKAMGIDKLIITDSSSNCEGNQFCGLLLQGAGNDDTIVVEKYNRYVKHETGYLINI